jgi:hypothetical protein
MPRTALVAASDHGSAVRSRAPCAPRGGIELTHQLVFLDRVPSAIDDASDPRGALTRWDRTAREERSRS